MARTKKTTDETKKTTPAAKSTAPTPKRPLKPATPPVVDATPSAPVRRKTLFQEVQEERESMVVAAKTRRQAPPKSAEAPVESTTETTPAKATRPRSQSRAQAHAPQEEPAKAQPKRPSQKSRTKKPSPVEEPVAKAVVPVAEPKGRTRRKAETAPSPELSAPGVPAPLWRKPTGPAPSEPQESRAESGESALAPRRTRTRKRKDRKDIEITAVVEPQVERREPRRAPVTEPVLSTPPPPAVVKRAQVPRPANAAQVVLSNGIPTLVKGQEILPPLVFFGSAMDEAQLATVLDQVKLAASNGVHVFSTLVELEVDAERVDESVAFAGYLLKKVSEADPECRLIFRLLIVAPAGWETYYKSAAYITEDGDLADPSLCDDPFWSDADECLAEFVRKLKKLDKNDRVLGVHLDRGEWFLSASAGYDTSSAAQAKFQEWLQHRYSNDVVSLRAAWFDGNVEFSSVKVPEFSEVRKPEQGFVRTDRRARRWVDYHLFLSDIACERLASLGYTVKMASDGSFLVGVSYGYTFEWSHPSSGHLSLGKLLRCPDIDYIGGPPSYKNREPGGSAPFPAPVDSFALNGKLYISEEDFKTPISGHREPDDFNPVMKTPQALGNVHWRGAGSALAHNAGVCWMDSWGNGWLNSRGIWERAQTVKRMMTWRQGMSSTPPDVAVFVDERSLAYLVDSRAFEALVQSVREAVIRSGLSAGFYLLSDLAHRENFPESKLHVFVNAWDVRPEVRSAIKSRLQRDDKVLFWLYSAGLFEGGRESLERVREVTGIALRPQPFYSKPGTTILNGREILCQNLPEQAMAKGGQLEPSYFAIPEDGLVLGEYSNTGLPSYVHRQFTGSASESWHSVFLGEPIVTPGLIRSLGQLAGAHVWNFQNDVVHVREPFLTVHCSGAGPRTIALPDKYVAYSLLDEDWTATEGNSLRFQGLDGATYTFLVGTRATVETALSSDEAALLRLETVDQGTDNTVHWDAMQFDVPIMKLDEWVEESWGEDLADDLLLKPSMLEVVEEAEPETDTQQRSRGRRRRRRSFSESDDRRSNERESDMAVNVMFRKRD